MGKLHSGNIESRPRYQRILNVFKTADYPPSGEEIAERIRSIIHRIPQAVSTTIGEMRSEENRQRGYIISYAAYWKVYPMEETGRRNNKDGSVTFLISAATEPWHDGRPRYWLMAAPGWVPMWSISDSGLLVPMRSANFGVRKETHPDAVIAGRICARPGCENLVPPERLREMAMTCCDECSDIWRKSIRPAFSSSGPGQGRLF